MVAVLVAGEGRGDGGRADFHRNQVGMPVPQILPACPLQLAIAGIKRADDFLYPHRNDRRATSRAVFAGVESFAAKRMGNEGFALKIEVSMRPAVRQDRRCYLNRATGIVPAERQDKPTVKVNVGAEATACVHASAESRCNGLHCDDRVLPPAFSGSGYAAAASDNAWCNVGGNALPRLAARRRIPMHAFALKKYRCGTSPVTNISDNEHTASTLWDGARKPVHSDELSVKHAPCKSVCALVAFDNARRSPSSCGDGDALSGEESQKACKVASSFA
ncbi:hypothetical protein BA190_09570 [Labrys sp. WJW]|nr:hypothetical protein BA190_09570 [Labrys sp. WJW]